MITLKEHIGVVLSPSDQEFDKFGSAFGCVLHEERESTWCLYYTGSIDKSWSNASIGVATSKDGVNFAKYPSNPILSMGKQSVTPAIFRASNDYWMVFALEPVMGHGRRLGIAVASNAFGPWTFVKQLIQPDKPWEGDSIDVGPSIVPVDDDYLVFYSNVEGGFFSRHIFGQKSIRRRMGILKLKVSNGREIQFRRWEGNPLSHLNGERGSWNESLFCPGYFRLHETHYLLPTGSIYSVGHPYKQYIGIVEDSSPTFEHPFSVRLLIDGPKEKNKILPTARSEIALDTPCPLMRQNELWLYYAVMDRADGIWKTALSIFLVD